MSEEEKKDQLSLDLHDEESASGDSPGLPDNLPDMGELAWVCHPARRNMKKTVLVTAFLFSLLIIIYYWTFSIWFVLLGALILFGSLASYYFPTRYKLSAEKIIIKTKAQTIEKKWEQFRTYYPDKNGVLLSPFTRPSRLENFRGVYIRFENNRDEVIGFVGNLIKSGGRSNKEAD